MTSVIPYNIDLVGLKVSTSSLKLSLIDLYADGYSPMFSVLNNDILVARLLCACYRESKVL